MCAFSSQGKNGFPGKRGPKGVAGKPVRYSSFTCYFIFCRHKQINNILKKHSSKTYVLFLKGPQGPKGKLGNAGLPGNKASIPFQVISRDVLNDWSLLPSLNIVSIFFTRSFQGHSGTDGLLGVVGTEGDPVSIFLGHFYSIN